MSNEIKIYHSYKTELDLNNKQRTILSKHAGAARFTWNWALNRIKLLAIRPNAMTLHKELNALKKTEFPWMYEVSKCAPQEALRNLQKAFDEYRKKKKNFPKFKTKKQSKQSFRLTGLIHVKEDKVKLPVIGWLKLKEKGYIPTNRKILSATCSKTNDKWFVSILVEETVVSSYKTSGVLGIDLGIKTLATCSDGTCYKNPKTYKKNINKLKRLRKKFTKQQNGSKRREKTLKKFKKLHYKVYCIRNDFLHKVTREIVKSKQPALVVLENLSIKNMIKAHNLAASLLDCSFYGFRQKLTYKQEWNGGKILLADKFFPSSKTCSQCGTVKQDLVLSDRVYKCSCGLSIDRDLNAAYNLKKLGESAIGLMASARGEDLVVKHPQRNENQTADVLRKF